MPLPSNPAGQRLLGKSIALLALTALLAYGCERGKQNAAPAPAPTPATPAAPAPSPSTPAATPPAKPAEPAKPAADAPAEGDETPKLPPIPHTEIPKDAKPLSEMTSPKGSTVQVIKEGSGTPTFPKALVNVHYVLYLKDGWKKLESTYDNGESLPVRLDAFVAGCADGIVGMKPGEVRRIIVPPALAWGKEGVKDKQGNYVIPPDSILVYDVELLNVKQVLVEPPAKPKPKPAAGPAPAPSPPAGK